MILQALLVSTDAVDAEALHQALERSGVRVECPTGAELAFSLLEAIAFDFVFFDFDDPETASLLLEFCRRQGEAVRNPPITLALLNHTAHTRSILGAGSNFALVKPFTPEQIDNTLRAAVALRKSERREGTIAAAQSPVSIWLEDGSLVEAIVIDFKSDESNIVDSRAVATDALDGGQGEPNRSLAVLATTTLARDSVVSLCFNGPRFKGNEGSETQKGAEEPEREYNAEVVWSSSTGLAGMRLIDVDAEGRAEIERRLVGGVKQTVVKESEATGDCALADLSPGGCYVETLSPFPQGSAVDVGLRAAALKIHAEGLVRVMHPGRGMGIEFPARTKEQHVKIANFIEFLAGQPWVKPQIEIDPLGRVADVVERGRSAQTADNPHHPDDPLRELLHDGRDLNEEEFLAELHRQRSPEDVKRGRQPVKAGEFLAAWPS